MITPISRYGFSVERVLAALVTGLVQQESV